MIIQLESIIKQRVLKYILIFSVDNSENERKYIT
jgi:hypothetical protein